MDSESIASPSTGPSPRPPRIVALVSTEDHDGLQAVFAELRQPFISGEDPDNARRAIEAHEIAVLVVDPRCDDPDDIDLITFAHHASPTTIRVALIDPEHPRDALEALNGGDVHRVLFRPVQHDQAIEILDAALSLHEVYETAHQHEHRGPDDGISPNALDELRRELDGLRSQLQTITEENAALNQHMQRNGDGIVHAMRNLLELGSTAIGDHCRRTAERACEFGRVLGLNDHELTALRQAAMLHWMGLLNAPPTVFQKEVEDFDSDELAYWDFHPLLGQQAVDQVEALERAGHIVSLYLMPFKQLKPRNLADLPFLVDQHFIHSVQALAMASFFERRHRKPRNEEDEWNIAEEGLARIQRGRDNHFDPELADLFVQMIQRDELGINELEIKLPIDRIHAGMVLARPIVTPLGLPVARAGMAVTPELLTRLQRFQSSTGLADIVVWHS